MIHANIIVGRLLGLRSASPITMAEVGELRDTMGKIFAGLKAARVVAAVDMRAAGVVGQDIRDAFEAMLKNDNPLMERSAWLISADKASLALQVERLIREAANPNRKCFTAAADVAAYLADVLTPDERKGLDRFLAASLDG